MHHVELLPDDDTDAALREEWRLLDVAGLPSLARHRSPSNRPHVTLTTTDGWPPPEARGAVDGPLGVLPLDVRVGGLLVLGRRRLVLARAVLATPGLLALHATLAGALGPEAVPHTGPGRWVPHLTLAQGLTAAQVGEAVEVLGGPGEGWDASLVAGRHWDAERRVEEPLGV
ncbi:2'-5' RNA ligase family protein [Phycicoccus sp. BSK3Z-2]|uniref:2'-5' RNA ligase family protein n=1 Tax=Phycicoccus avicenniae TaxID=2828860 RepID=A0A941D851_9MICO|nr:2'-5' RNA ligase family protein [Phycicoccus avicenniae]MBR7743578.1 2'-5' RNA ligase family protein [Phycicoccus avicenniae]